MDILISVYQHFSRRAAGASRSSHHDGSSWKTLMHCRTCHPVGSSATSKLMHILGSSGAFSFCLNARGRLLEGASPRKTTCKLLFNSDTTGFSNSPLGRVNTWGMHLCALAGLYCKMCPLCSIMNIRLPALSHRYKGGYWQHRREKNWVGCLDVFGHEEVMPGAALRALPSAELAQLRLIDGQSRPVDKPQAKRL